ncbi:MAG: iron-sulfur cluster assembly accessory protein [Vicingaceae bacterium]
MLKVKDSARDKIFTLLEADGKKQDSFVRVGVKGGGCSGLMYNLEFDSEQKEGDKLIEDNNIKLLVDKKSVLYLVGTELDFSDGLNGKGFSFTNPNASRTCGCGESFSI